ncbi:hypothetical protein BKA66DRAFT_475792 [Pyrenochaeta sp. MPI-SDFR-AT-0127]|nr:hypothetical protein BKA66DRAFT_475792 [Pyrenochaeta sp. MPI-SDFR-AT-0127]
MGRIFSLASCVIVWLGHAAEGSDDALNRLRYLARNIDINWRDFTMRPSAQSTERSLANFQYNLPYFAGELDTVGALYNRPYFERTWIRQEITLAARAVVQCGRQTMEWDDFRTATASIYWKGFNQAALVNTSATDCTRALHTVFKICRIARGGYRYANIRRILRDAKCSDPRDKLYAVCSMLDAEDQDLGLKPDYTRPVEELYTDLASRFLTSYHNLALLESCELAAKVLDIPSWVPDWSSRMAASNFPFTNWSACAWISAQVIVVNENQIRVAGVLATQVEHVMASTIMEFDDRVEAKLQLMRELRPSVQAWAARTGSFAKSVEMHCRALVCNAFSDFYWPARLDNPVFDDNYLALFRAWMAGADEKAFEEAIKKVSPHYWSVLSDQIVGRCIFSTTDGHIGLAPAGTQAGDVVSVLLGCRYPVLLRPVSDSKEGPTWQVVGICHAKGLMMGEAIYGDRLPSHYRSVERKDRQGDLVDGYRVGLYDSKTETIKSNPDEILKDMGIEVENYKIYPHKLEVLPEKLRAAGVALQDFTLV